MIKTDKVIYRTRTQEEYDWLMTELAKSGCKWFSGHLSTKLDYWHEHGNKTSICISNKNLIYDKYSNAYTYFASQSLCFEYIEVSKLMEETEKGKHHEEYN